MSDYPGNTATPTAPRVTVLMSVYNGERFLRQAIDSILSQSYRDFEFLIINDASTDSSREIIRSYPDSRIRLVDNVRNLGLTKSLNVGLELSRGALIARQDADDISHPARLQKQVEYLAVHPEVALLGTQHRQIADDGRVLKSTGVRKPTDLLSVRWNLMFGASFVHTSVMFRRAVIWDELGGYNPAYLVGQDAELWARVSGRHVVLNLKDCLVDYRCHAGSISGNLLSPIRAGHAERMEALLQMLMQRNLQWAQVPSEWSRLWVDLNTTRPFIGAARALEFLTAVDAMLSRFVELFPTAITNREIISQIATVQLHVAYYLVARDRRGSLVAFWRACRTDFFQVCGTAPKYFTLLLLGDGIRQAYRRLKRPQLIPGSVISDAVTNDA